MSSTKFIAILPQPTQPGDKIQISGRISEHAEEFSINFANEANEDPQSVTYRFNWDLAHQKLIEDNKEDDEWKNRKETEFDTFDGRFKNKAINDSISNRFIDNNTIADTTDTFPHSYSLLGPEFALEFAFQDDGIYVYLVSEDGRNLVTHYEPQIDLQFIESVQVCGDVEKVTQLTFSYN
ncbi:uncharacterized protein LOC120782841 isoform X1 [Bactrocera tryoni]|uniref:uncharacterized protein LOC120782841 isoform X1 n=1 Tax=Bactrocera tryoni TaxID=59916 RepID=UPI001A9666AC|nr:uncharacterized protein LOC120782841 isoform X1 [Bactrocera tryoni]XP_039971301.1 uncharacterized protein LOC120782841 isoform X1 [Bactrocera tryoni]